MCRLVPLLFLLSLLLVGCGSSLFGSAHEHPPQTTLTWGVAGLQDVPSLDPALASDPTSISLCSLVYGGLVRLDEHLTVRPDGAASWTISPDGTIYTFTLRRHLRFADGTKVVAKDFVAAIRRALGPDGSGGAGPFYLSAIARASSRNGAIPAVQAVSPNTVRITLAHPAAQFLSELAFPASFVAQPSLSHTYGPVWTEHAAGFGPFAVTTWRHGQFLQLLPNTHYYGGKVALKRITVRMYASTDAAVTAYNHHILDLVSGLPAGTSPANRPVGLRSMPGLALDYLAFNTTKIPFHHLNARRAFAAVVTPDLSARIMGRSVVALHGFLPSGFPLSLPAWVPGEKASTYLQGAGYPKGKGFPTVTLIYPRDAGLAPLATSLADAWQATLHVTVSVRGLNATNYTAALDAHAFDLALVRWGADYPAPQDFLATQLGSSHDNITGWNPPRYDQLLTQANLAPEPQRDELYRAAGIMAAEHLAVYPLDEPALYAVISPTLRGVSMTPLGTISGPWVHVHFSD